MTHERPKPHPDRALVVAGKAGPAWGLTIRQALAACRALPTAAERLQAVLELEVSRCVGAPALRALQAEIKRRLWRLGDARREREGTTVRWTWDLVKRVTDADVPRTCTREAWYRLRHDRRHRDWKAVQRRRAEEAALARYRPVIQARGGETSIEGDRDTEYLEVADLAQGLALLHCEGWRYYSRRFGSRRASLSYLCGTDDSGDWAARVPGTITTCAEAMQWLEPGDVRRAREMGRRVLRQGDVYAIETTRQHDGRGLVMQYDGSLEIGDHTWSHRRWLLHPEHDPLHVPFPARFVEQAALEMGRSGRYGRAD